MANVIDVKSSMSTGVKVFSAGGEQLSLVAVDAAGNTVTGGKELADALFSAALDAYENYWAGKGHLTTIKRIEYAQGS